MSGTAKLRSIATAVGKWSYVQYDSAPIAVALLAVTASVIFAASTYGYEASQDRLQRQCLAYVDALGSSMNKMQVLYALAQGNSGMEPFAKAIAGQLQLTDANRPYCSFPR